MSAAWLHINICMCYHPPKLIYDSSVFDDLVVENFEHLLAINSDDVFYINWRLESDEHE